MFTSIPFHANLNPIPEELSVSGSSGDQEKADMRIVQAAAQEASSFSMQYEYPSQGTDITWSTSFLNSSCSSLSVQVLGRHCHVLGRGLMVNMPTIHHILGGDIPVIDDSTEQLFLKDFVESKLETAGGRLAR